MNEEVFDAISGSSWNAINGAGADWRMVNGSDRDEWYKCVHAVLVAAGLSIGPAR